MIYQILGLILFLTGCSHLAKWVNRLEPKLILTLQNKLKKEPVRNFFKEIWFFGRTSFLMIVLIFLICINWKTGLVASGVYLLFVGIEQVVKTSFKRVRPFANHQNITMLQPLEPTDPSFPSGDALRAWYLALIIPAAAGSPIFFLASAVSLAILVTLGRMIMGVHYLTDTLSGAGLGILGAGTTIWLWTFINLI